MNIIDGKKTAEKILAELKEKTAKLDTKPGLAVILANENSASRVYVASKEKKSMELGFQSRVYRFDRTVTQNKILALIEELNFDPAINAILVQLPLFEHLNTNEIIEAIDPKKDVDGFHPLNLGRLLSGQKPYAVCCTPLGIMKLLEEYKIDVSGKNAVVIGRSNIVGKPIATLLLKANASVSVVHSKSKDIKSFTKNADILICATGKPKLVTSDMVKKGAVVIDVGITRNLEGKLLGDVDFEHVKNVASYITPVPGGVGPMTIACLMENTYNLYMEQLRN